MKDILHAIKMLYLATTFISHKKILKKHKNKHETIVHLNQKLGEEKDYCSLLIRIF